MALLTEPERLTTAERIEYRERWLRALVAHAYDHAPAMRERIPSRVAPLDAIRITRKDELIDLQRAAPPFGGFLGVPLADVARLFLSPGPLFDPQGLAPDYWRWAGALRAAGFEAGMVVHCAVSYHGTPLGWMFDGALRELGCTVIPAGTGNTELQVQMLRGLAASGYVGTPSALRILYEKAAELGADGFTLRRAFVAGEMLPPSLRRELQDRGPTVCQGYGTADLGALGYECLERDGMHVPADAVVEIVDPRTGEALPTGTVGEVVATVNERTYPIVRFGTGDLALLTEDPCRCGRAGERIVRIVGRVGDAVKVRGMFVHPRQVDEVVARFPQVVRWQMVVTRDGARDVLTLRVVSAGELDRARLAQTVQDVIKVRPEVERADGLADDAPRMRDLRTWE
jgi:phenylacetate-CoA ligase